jgi:hypothetical protein
VNALHQALSAVHLLLHLFLPPVLIFLPLVLWAIFAFGVLYSLLESHFRPLAVLLSSLMAAVRIVTGHWRIAAALFALFIAAPIVEALSVFVLNMRGLSLLLTALCWQAVTAAAIAWIATYIHGHTLSLPERSASAQRRYRAMSLVAGVTLFLFGLVFSNMLALALHALGFSLRFHLDYLARVLQTLVFVPMALVRPAMSLGVHGPVRNAVIAAARPPFVVAVWVTALGLPSVAFDWLGVDIVRAHQGVTSELAFQVARAAFQVADCVFFETTTLLLFARETHRFLLPDEA